MTYPPFQYPETYNLDQVLQQIEQARTAGRRRLTAKNLTTLQRMRASGRRAPADLQIDKILISGGREGEQTREPRAPDVIRFRIDRTTIGFGTEQNPNA